MKALFEKAAPTQPRTSPPVSGGLFPLRPALALATTVVLLVAAHLLPGGSHGVPLSVFRDAGTLRLPHQPAPLTGATMPVSGVQQTAGEKAVSAAAATATAQKHTEPRATTKAPAVPASLMVGSEALGTFYAQLWTLQQRTVPTVVTVLHYGDSPTTADLITGDLRALLQQRFGDAGYGFNLAAKPWAWYGHRNIEMSDKGWASSQKDATPVGRMKTGVYGLGGAVFAGSAGAQTTYTLHGLAPTAVAIDYLASPGGGSLGVFANDVQAAAFDTAGSGPMRRVITLSKDTKIVKVVVTAGSVKLFGVDFGRGNEGIVYDSLGLNGATTTVLSRTFDAGAWRAELQAVKPALIVINYGTNESQFGGLVDTLDKELRSAVEKTRTAAPGVPILIMSPMDRGEHSGLSDIQTNPLIPRIVGIQQKVAEDEHCAFFNTYAAMGGEGTMARWYAARPRLVTADLIHPTPQGAEYVARLLVGALYGGYDQWKGAHGFGVVKVEEPVEAATQHKAKTEKTQTAVAQARARSQSTSIESPEVPAKSDLP